MGIRAKLILVLVSVAAGPFLLAMTLAWLLFSAAVEDAAHQRARAGVGLVSREVAQLANETLAQVRTFSRLLPVRRAIILRAPMNLRHQLVPLREGFSYHRLDAWDRECLALMRAEDPGNYGDSLASDPVVLAVAVGSEVATLVSRPDGLHLEVAVPVAIEEEVLGGLRAAHRLDRNLLDRWSALLGVEVDLGPVGADPAGDAGCPRFSPGGVEGSAAVAGALPPATSAVGLVASGVSRRLDVAGRELVVAGGILHDGWGRPIAWLRTTASLTAIRAGVGHAWTRLAGCFVLCLLAAVALGIGLSGRVVGPVRLFTEAAVRMASGRLDDRVEVRSRDELGALGDAFNRMAFNLGILLRLSRESAFAANVDAVVALNLEMALEALGAARGSLMLFDARRQALVIHRVAGFTGAIVERAAFRPGEGIAGVAFAEKRTVICDDPAADPRFLVLEAGGGAQPTPLGAAGGPASPASGAGLDEADSPPGSRPPIPADGAPVPATGTGERTVTVHPGQIPVLRTTARLPLEPQCGDRGGNRGADSLRTPMGGAWPPGEQLQRTDADRTVGEAGPAAASPVRLRNLMVAPLITEEEAIGVIQVIDKAAGRFDDADRNLLEVIANQVAQAIHRARLYELAITDGLTGLYIHRYFQARLRDEILRAQRHGQPVSLVMTDIDHFKRINDTCGHQQGDVVLREVAEILRRGVRSIDLPARYGGEEFAVVLPNTPIESAALLAERLRAAVANRHFTGMSSAGAVTISLGIAAWPLHAAEAGPLIAKADKALYQAKHRGRNCVIVAGEGEPAS